VFVSLSCSFRNPLEACNRTLIDGMDLLYSRVETKTDFLIFAKSENGQVFGKNRDISFREQIFSRKNCRSREYFRENFRLRESFQQKIVKKLYHNYFLRNIFAQILVSAKIFVSFLFSRKFSHLLSFSQKFSNHFRFSEFFLLFSYLFVSFFREERKHIFEKIFAKVWIQKFSFQF
jgi:hypothetical protein